MPCCDGQKCNFIDVIHFQSRIRHYEDGRIKIAWNHHPMVGEPSSALPDGWDSRTNFAEFCSSNVASRVWDEAGQGYWYPVFYCLGQHPFKIEDLFEELDIELTPEEDAKLNNCSLMLFVGTVYVWDLYEESELTPGLDYRLGDESVGPKVTAVATSAGTGELVKVIWSDQMYETGYFWSEYFFGTDCGGGGGVTYIDQQECVWDEERPGNNLPNYRTEFLICSTQPTSERVVFLGVPATKRTVGPGPTFTPVVGGNMVQIRNVKTGQLLFDGAVEAEGFRTGYTFTGEETTSTDPPIGDPPYEPPPEEEYVEEEFWYPAILRWGYATNDKNLIGCLGLYANRSDTEELEIDPPEWRTDGLPYYAGMRLATFSPFPENPFLLREVKRSPLGFNPSTAQPTFGPDDTLWVTGFWSSAGLAFDDPAFEIEYGVWSVTYATVDDPEKVERLSNVVGSLSQHCYEVYALGKQQVYDPETDELGEYLQSTRTKYYEGEGDDPEPLSSGFVFGIGYYGWAWGFWTDDSGTDFFGWDTLGWNGFGFGYQGWDAAGGLWLDNYLNSPIHWSMYVVADMTEGGDRDKFEFAKVDNVQVMTNPCLVACADGDLSGGGSDCSTCDCETAEIDVTVGEEETTCCGCIPLTVNCSGFCGSLVSWDYRRCNTCDGIALCEDWVTGLPCGETIYLQESGYYQIRARDECGCQATDCVEIVVPDPPISLSVSYDAGTSCACVSADPPGGLIFGHEIEVSVTHPEDCVPTLDADVDYSGDYIVAWCDGEWELREDLSSPTETVWRRCLAVATEVPIGMPRTGHVKIDATVTITDPVCGSCEVSEEFYIFGSP